jgi:alkanesulfonate monooxygenase SsuD/methylene tetrahydromethanopterin reductase-like flavin-dependent oxidoreductase (luciferase family)
VSEHHFWDDSWTPAPLTLLSAMAARTEKIQLATGIVLAPLQRPITLAEEAATVDLISKGRLLLGLSIGWRPIEFDAMEVPIKQRAARTEDAIKVLRAAWSNEVVTSEGLSRVHIPEGGVQVFPKPAQPGGPPIWLAGFAEAAARRAGRMADGWLSYSSQLDDFKQVVEWIQDEMEESRPFEYGLCIPTLAWNDGSAADEARDHFYYASWKYIDVEEQRDNPTGTVHAPPPFTGDDQVRQRRGALHTLATKATDSAGEDAQIGLFGTPEEVAESIREYSDVVDGNLHYVAQLYLPGMSFERHVEAMRIFAEEVIPRVRQ